MDNRFEIALEEARQVDQFIQSGEKDEKTIELETPFLGVPFTIKDCFSVKGFLAFTYKYNIQSKIKYSINRNEIHSWSCKEEEYYWTV